MKASELCRVRSIADTTIETPLLVPSYSSRGFDPSPIFEDTTQYCLDSKLLSAYDIHYELIDRRHIYSSADLLFIDSGHYERIATHNPGEPYEDMRRGEESWSIPLYDETLKSLETEQCKIVRVTYDRYESIRRQISAARRSMQRHPGMLVDFLMKPERGPHDHNRPKQFYDAAAVARHAKDLEFADIIGFTEKELGVSYRERAETLARIRGALVDAGVDRPIHVFGCLDPFGVLLYVAVGADIYDGLSWLRFAWVNGQLTYIPNAVALDGLAHDRLEASVRYFQVRNLSEVRRLAAAAKSLARNHGFRDVPTPWRQYEPAVTNLLKDIDVDLEVA